MLIIWKCKQITPRKLPAFERCWLSFWPYASTFNALVRRKLNTSWFVNAFLEPREYTKLCLSSWGTWPISLLRYTTWIYAFFFFFSFMLLRVSKACSICLCLISYKELDLKNLRVFFSNKQWVIFICFNAFWVFMVHILVYFSSPTSCST